MTRLTDEVGSAGGLHAVKVSKRKMNTHCLKNLLSTFPLYHALFWRANGWRYPLVGGTRQRHFTGTNLKLRKVPENAQTPTSRVHALLGSLHVDETPLSFAILNNSSPVHPR